MSEYLHKKLELTSGDTVKVTLDQQANVLILDDDNYKRYTENKNYIYYGGYAKQSPINLPTPYPGTWNLVIDLGGREGTIKYSVTIIKKNIEN